MADDQYTFTDPAKRYAHISPEKQHQPEPGLDAELDPKADRSGAGGPGST